jgi:hypothetical protein
MHTIWRRVAQDRFQIGKRAVPRSSHSRRPGCVFSLPGRASTTTPKIFNCTQLLEKLKFISRSEWLKAMTSDLPLPR